MAQFGRPISDITNTGVWTTTPIWSKLNGVVGSDDSDFVTSDSNPLASETFVLDCGTIIDPSVSTGHILRIRGNKNTGGGANFDIVCELRQGYVSEVSLGTLIATVTILDTASTTPVTQALTLSGGEADTITDYSDLQFRCWAVKNGGGAGRACDVVDVEIETPDAGGITLTVQDSSHSHTAENVVLDSKYSITVQDSSHSHTADNVVLDSKYTLVVDGSNHVHTADNIVLTNIGFLLVVQDSSHNHTADNIVLTHKYTIVVDDSSHIHTADNIVLTHSYLLVVDDSRHIHTAENITLSSKYSLTVQNSRHIHTADNVVLDVSVTLVVQDSSHAHKAENIVLTSKYLLTVDDSSHNHTAENIVLTVKYTLVTQNSRHIHTAENVVLSTNTEDNSDYELIVLKSFITLVVENNSRITNLVALNSLIVPIAFLDGDKTVLKVLKSIITNEIVLKSKIK